LILFIFVDTFINGKMHIFILGNKPKKVEFGTLYSFIMQKRLRKSLM
jgi:hypothetical protein